MLSQSLGNPVDQLKTPQNPAGFRLTLAPNVSRPIIPYHQATTLKCGLLEVIPRAGCEQAPHRWITWTAPHCWIVGRSARGLSARLIGCASPFFGYPLYSGAYSAATRGATPPLLLLLRRREEPLLCFFFSGDFGRYVELHFSLRPLMDPVWSTSHGAMS